MNKKIILINESGLNEVFTEAFIKEGYEVFSILRDPFVYKKNLWTKLMNIYYRVVLKNTNFHGENYYKQINKEIYRRLQKLKTQTDYALIFRADYYSKKNIELLQKKSKVLISYQYDGWELGKGIIKHKDYLDRVFFFEKEDMIKYGEKAFPLTNCYFPEFNQNNSTIDFDVYYLGTGTKTRLDNIVNLHNFLQDKCIFKSIIKIPHYQMERNDNGMILTHKGLSYFENLDLLMKSKCLVDIKFEYHNGLSFRFFEALFYNKKIITNNESVKSYDFYNPDNIYITDFKNFEGLEQFLNKPYKEINKKIVDKYSFKNWSRYVLDLPDYQEIDLP